mmetsp:Transcript_11475/g.20001  ORF Transcript_11475/g.20001 Transcript_11475/m.20001 type:complete len:133 (+) Transcript_11475:1-399(+)
MNERRSKVEKLLRAKERELEQIKSDQAKDFEELRIALAKEEAARKDAESDLQLVNESIHRLLYGANASGKKSPKKGKATGKKKGKAKGTGKKKKKKKGDGGKSSDGESSSTGVAKVTHEMGASIETSTSPGT